MSTITLNASNDIYLVDDIAELKLTDINHVADIVQQRLSAGFQYTKIGDNMLVIVRSPVVPPKSPTAESVAQEKNFAQKLRQSLSAAVSMVNKILQCMSDQDEPNQSILFLGDHLSGKSDALTRMLAFFKTASIVVSNRKANVIGDLVIKSCQLAETFGHTRTTKHNNSSRIAKYIKIYHANEEENLELLSWTIDIIPFDRSRVYGAHSGRPQDIGNFHIFYQLASGLASVNRHLAIKLKLTATKNFNILSSSFASKFLPGIDLELSNDPTSFATTALTFKLLGFNDMDQNSLYTAIAAVMHLGNISVNCNFNDDRKDRIELVYINESEHTMTLQEISSLLGISHSEFEAILLKWPLADGQPLYAMFESTIVLEIKTRIHKVMEFIYWQVVACIFLSLNQRFHENINEGEAPYSKYVSFIDFPGFEDNYPWNSLETLFINFASERINAHGNQYFSFLIGQYEAKSEEAIVGVPVTTTDSTDVIDLLMRDKVGIFPVMNKFSRMQAAAGCSDDVSMLLSQRHPHGVDILTSSQDKSISHGFRITHFNKLSVCYDVDGFIEKNRIGHDCIRGLDTLLASSTEAFVRRLAKIFTIEQMSPRATSTIMNPKFEKGKIRPTASEMLSSQLDSIIDEIATTNNRFVACLDGRHQSSAAGSALSTPSKLPQTPSAVNPNQRSTMSSPTNRNSRATSSKISPARKGAARSPGKGTPSKASSFDFKGTDLQSREHIANQLQCYHIAHILALQRAKYPVILSHAEFLDVAIVFARAKGWVPIAGTSTETLASRCNALAEYLLIKGSYCCGKLTIMFTSSSYASTIQLQADVLVVHSTTVIQSLYRRYRSVRKFKLMMKSIVVLQSCFRKNLWKKLMVRILAVRRERRLAALRQQEQEVIQYQQALEEKEMERQLQEQFQHRLKPPSDSTPLDTKAFSSPTLSRSVSFSVDKKAQNVASLINVASSPLASSRSVMSTPAKPTLQQSPPRGMITPTRSSLKPPSSSLTARPPLVSTLTPRTAAWIDSLPAGLNDDPDIPYSPTASSKPLNTYNSFTPVLLNTGGDGTTTDPIQLSRRLDAYHVLTTKLLSVWRKYSLWKTLDSLRDAVYRKKPHLLVDILSKLRRRRVEEADSLPYVKDKSTFYRNLYHLAVSVGSIDCVNALGVTMLDVIVRDQAQNNWLHIMTESPNFDFLQRVHNFIQRYDQVIKAAQPNRALYASILSIIGSPTTLRTGWLQKLSTSDKLQRRYVVLTSSKIAYYNTYNATDGLPDIKNASDVLLVSVDQTIIRHNRDLEYSFILDSIADLKSTKGKKRFIFKATSKEEYHQWLKALSQVTTIATTRDPGANASNQSSREATNTPVNIVNPLITRLWVSDLNIFGNTPLHSLAAVQVVKQDATIQKISLATMAAEFDETYHIISTASWLLDNGCFIDSVNIEGRTALDLAILNQSYDLASFLIRKGASTKGLQDHILREIESRDCFKGMIYQNRDTPHLPPPEKWYNFTYFSMSIQEIHLQSSHDRSSGTMSVDQEYWMNMLPCPYLSISVKDPKGKILEANQSLCLCGYRGFGMMVWGETYHLQTPLQATENKSVIEVSLMNYNTLTRSSTEIACGKYELDFTNVNSGPASIYMEPKLVTTKSSRVVKQLEPMTLIADVALTQRNFELQVETLEEYVVTTYGGNAMGYNYPKLLANDRNRDSPFVKFIATLPPILSRNEVIKNIAGRRGVHVKIPGDCKAGQKVIIEASVKKVYGRAYFYQDIENGVLDIEADDQSVSSRRSSSRSSSPRASRSLSRMSSRGSGFFDSPEPSDRRSISSKFTPDSPASTDSRRASSTPRRKIEHKSSIYLRSGI
jgi:hypothetical protein